MAPFYNKPPQRGIYEYFKALAQSTDKPIVLYNVPGRTGCNIEAETTLALARDIPNIVGVKEASGNIGQIQAILDGRPDGFSVLSGNDDQTFELMQKGADGVISVASNIVPEKVSAMTRAALDGRWEDAEALDEALKPLYHACFVEPNPIPAKAALSLLGLCTPTMRLPLVQAEPGTFDLMKEVLAGL